MDHHHNPIDNDPWLRASGTINSNTSLVGNSGYPNFNLRASSGSSSSSSSSSSSTSTTQTTATSSIAAPTTPPFLGDLFDTPLRPISPASTNPLGSSGGSSSGTTRSRSSLTSSDSVATFASSVQSRELVLDGTRSQTRCRVALVVPYRWDRIPNEREREQIVDIVDIGDAQRSFARSRP